MAPLERLDLQALLDGIWTDHTRPRALFASHIRDDAEGYAPLILAGLRAPERKVQNGCAELLSLLAEHRPDLLVAEIPRLIEGLDDPAKILQWECACTLGHVARADTEGRVLDGVEALVGLLAAEGVVLRGHVARALARIAEAHPAAAGEILDALLDHAGRFRGNQVGVLVEAMPCFAAAGRGAGAAGGPSALARAFVEGQLEHEQAVVRLKAKKALRAFDGVR